MKMIARKDKVTFFILLVVIVPFFWRTFNQKCVCGGGPPWCCCESWLGGYHPVVRTESFGRYLDSDGMWKKAPLPSVEEWAKQQPPPDCVKVFEQHLVLYPADAKFSVAGLLISFLFAFVAALLSAGLLLILCKIIKRFSFHRNS